MRVWRRPFHHDHKRAPAATTMASSPAVMLVSRPAGYRSPRRVRGESARAPENDLNRPKPPEEIIPGRAGFSGETPGKRIGLIFHGKEGVPGSNPGGGSKETPCAGGISPGHKRFPERRPET